MLLYFLSHLVCKPYEFHRRSTVSLGLHVYCLLASSLTGAHISLGDVQSNYLLTTAENELGVVVAHSEAGGARQVRRKVAFSPRHYKNFYF